LIPKQFQNASLGATARRIWERYVFVIGRLFIEEIAALQHDCETSKDAKLNIAPSR
jgi:hypothetical protein